MICPENRLLFHAAAVFAPALALAAAFPENAPAFATVAAAFALLAVSDAFLGKRKAAHFSLALPELVRLFRDRPGQLEILATNETANAERIRIGIAMPPRIETDTVELEATLPDGAIESRLPWNLTARSHGQCFIPAAYLQVRSPLGYWGVRKKCDAACEVRVYPDLNAEKKHLAALFSKRGAGVHPIRQIGKGREFEQLRDYMPGDIYEDIYWKATARRNRPVTRIYQVERTQEIYAVLDSSRFSGRLCQGTSRHVGEPSDANIARTDSGPRGATVLDRFVTAAMVLGLAARSQGDLFGVLTFSDKVERFVRAGAGKAHYSACCDALYTLRPTTKAPNLEEVFRFVATKLRRRSLLVFLTSLDDPVYAESFVRRLEIVRRKHLVMVGMLKPERARPMFTGKNVSVTEDLFEELGAHILWSQLKETEKGLLRKGAAFHLLENERLCGQLVSHYLTIKRRQLL